MNLKTNSSYPQFSLLDNDIQFVWSGKLNEGYTLQGGVGLLQISNIIGESKISSNTNAAATMTIEILYTQAVIRQ